MEFLIKKRKGVNLSYGQTKLKKKEANKYMVITQITKTNKKLKAKY